MQTSRRRSPQHFLSSPCERVDGWSQFLLIAPSSRARRWLCYGYGSRQRRHSPKCSSLTCWSLRLICRCLPQRRSWNDRRWPPSVRMKKSRRHFRSSSLVPASTRAGFHFTIIDDEKLLHSLDWRHRCAYDSMIHVSFQAVVVFIQRPLLRIKRRLDQSWMSPGWRSHASWSWPASRRGL